MVGSRKEGQKKEEAGHRYSGGGEGLTTVTSNLDNDGATMLTNRRGSSMRKWQKATYGREEQMKTVAATL